MRRFVDDALAVRRDLAAGEDLVGWDPLTSTELFTTGARARVEAGGTVEELERLAALRDRGALTEAEFAAAKARVLGG